MTYSTHAVDAEKIGTATTCHTVRSIRRRRHNRALSHSTSGINILGYGF